MEGVWHVKTKLVLEHFQFQKNILVSHLQMLIIRGHKLRPKVPIGSFHLKLFPWHIDCIASSLIWVKNYCLLVTQKIRFGAKKLREMGKWGRWGKWEKICQLHISTAWLCWFTSELIKCTWSIQGHNWMAWWKTNISDLFGWNFFSSKVPEFPLKKKSKQRGKNNQGKNSGFEPTL